MSPILGLQRQLREIGRIRMGEQVGTGRERRPRRLATFRLTSTNRGVLEEAASLYGGSVTPWESPGGAAWQLTIEAAALDVVIPPGERISQWMELWSGGGCERRCDGVTETLTRVPCLCPADVATRVELAAKGEACKATTRLRVMLPELADLGVWRLESHGYYAAVELAGMADVVAALTGAGGMVRARLRLDHRQVRRPGQPVRKFSVPIIELPDFHLADVVGPGQGVVASLGPGRPPASTTRPELPAGPPLPAIAEPMPTPAVPSRPGASTGPTAPVEVVCGAETDPRLGEIEFCALAAGHDGVHRTSAGSTWAVNPIPVKRTGGTDGEGD